MALLAPVEAARRQAAREARGRARPEPRRNLLGAFLAGGGDTGRRVRWDRRLAARHCSRAVLTDRSSLNKQAVSSCGWSGYSCCPQGCCCCAKQPRERGTAITHAPLDCPSGCSCSAASGPTCARCAARCTSPTPPPHTDACTSPPHACRTGPIAHRCSPHPVCCPGPPLSAALCGTCGDARGLPAVAVALCPTISATLGGSAPPQARKGLLSGPHFPRRRVSLPLNAHFGIARRAELHRPRGRRGVCDLSDPSSP